MRIALFFIVILATFCDREKQLESYREQYKELSEHKYQFNEFKDKF